MAQNVAQMTKNLCFIELSQSWYRVYFEHADYEYGHDLGRYCHQIGPNGTKSGKNDKKFVFHRIVSRLVQSQFQTC